MSASVILQPYQKSVFNAPGSAGQASVSSETPNANEQIIVVAFDIELSHVADPGYGITWSLRDGPSITGTQVMSGRMYAGALQSARVFFFNLFLPMTIGRVATLECDLGGLSNDFQSVNLVYTRSGLIG